MMETLCNTCTSCEFMPKQDVFRSLSLSYCVNGTPPLVLVIDEPHDVGLESMAMQKVKELLVKDISFDYCTSVRCDGRFSLTNDEIKDALSRCSVWTNHISGGRALILTGVSGLTQLKIEDHKEGDLFRHDRLGVVLVVPCIYGAVMDINFSTYQKKVQRALKVLKL